MLSKFQLSALVPSTRIDTKYNGDFISSDRSMIKILKNLKLKVLKVQVFYCVVCGIPEDVYQFLMDFDLGTFNVRWFQSVLWEPASRFCILAWLR